MDPAAACGNTWKSVHGIVLKVPISKRDGNSARFDPPFSSRGHVGQFIIKITKSKLLELKARCIMGCGEEMDSDNLLVIIFSRYHV